MHIPKTPSVLLCLSAFLLALGTYLCTIEQLVWIGSEYEPMHVYLPLGFLLWLLAFLLLTWAILSGVQKLRVVRLATVFSTPSSIVGVALGVLVMTSTLLPWVVAERSEPLIETRAGTFDVGHYHTLMGIDLLIGINRIDEISLAFVGAIIGALYIPLLCVLETKRPDAIRTFLFLFGGICIAVPAALVYTQGTWWIGMRVDGVLGFAATSVGPGLGFLATALCGIGSISSGIINMVRPF